MRITKKMLKEACYGLMRRMNELAIIAEEGQPSLLSEHKRVFLYRDDNLRPALFRGLLQELLTEAMEKKIPSHWTES